MIKVQINSKEAFDDVIKNDKDFEIRIKKAILNDYAKTFLKSIVNSELVKRLQNNIIEELRINNYYDVKHRLGFKEYLSSTVRKQIYDEVESCIKDSIDEIMKKEFNNIIEHAKKELERKINNLTQSQFELYVKSQIKNSLTDIINKLK